LPKIIPYLASKFTQEKFKKMQIKLKVVNQEDPIPGLDGID
jgi:hypothetical protein